MADETQKDEKTTEETPPKKGFLRRHLGKILMVAVVFLFVGTFVGGLAAGPQLGSKFRIPGYVAPPAPPPDPNPPAAMTHRMDPLIVDIHEEDGMLHHLKVGIAVELKKDVTKEEFEKYEARVRDAALKYFRTVPYKKITDPEQFDALRDELSKHIIESAGEKRVQQILFTDFVVQ